MGADADKPIRVKLGRLFKCCRPVFLPSVGQVGNEPLTEATASANGSAIGIERRRAARSPSFSNVSSQLIADDDAICDRCKQMCDL